MPISAADESAMGRSGASGPVIVETKLARPPVRAEHVVRRELVERLHAGAGRKLILLTAPPGFGKTTLLAEWATSDEGQAVAWLSLDDDDNDPARFFAYAIAALRTVEPGIGAGALAALEAPGAGLVEVVLPLLLNDLAALDIGVALVLDDYHLITNNEIHEAVAYLLDHLPASVRLVLATREDPPLLLGRLRARGELCELRVGELRFSSEEARSFLNEVLELDLSADDLEQLQARTEGWPAALYLAALSLRGRDDPSTIIAAFAGDDRHLVDYLTAEVLARQPPALRSFLLQTSILKRFTGSLCDAVTDRDDSLAVLAELERSNLLLVPLDAKRDWYRYHQLFAELLQHELARTDAAAIPTLHQRASNWYRQADMIVEAAGHATAAGDVDTAVELVGCCWPLFLEQGQLATVARWLQVLPKSVIAENWLLCLAGVTVAAHTNALDEAERWLEAAEHAPHLARIGQQPGGPIAAARAFIRLYRGDLEGAIASARLALTAATSAEPAWAVGPQLVLGGALWWSQELTEAKTVFETAARTAQAAGLAPATVETLGFRAAIALDKEDPERADELTREALELTCRAKLEEHPFTAMARVALGKTYTLRGEPTKAQAEIERGIQLAEREHNWLVSTYGLLALAELRRNEHEPAAARRLLGQARSRLEALPAHPSLARIEQSEQTLRLRATRDRDSVSAPYWELSERELTVLRLLASRLSQREIAAELYVSFNTVKSHSRSIFHKLGVASRAEAVDRGHELGLL